MLACFSELDVHSKKSSLLFSALTSQTRSKGSGTNTFCWCMEPLMVNKLITTKFYDSPLLFTHCSCICKTSKQICEHCWFLSTFLFHDTSLFCADNVHFASSAQLVRALQDAEIQYRFQVCERNQHFTFLSYDVVQLKLYICTKYKIV